MIHHTKASKLQPLILETEEKGSIVAVTGVGMSGVGWKTGWTGAAMPRVWG
jgi:hypothetical protein